MTITNEILLERIDQFLLDITVADTVTLVHDTDPDGICSSAIIARCIERIRSKKIDLAIPLDKTTHSVTPETIKKIKAAKTTILITCDFSFEEQPDVIKNLEKTCKILIIDHHKLCGDVTSDQTILYKPHLFCDIDPARYCTGKLAYDAAARVVDIEDLDWMAAAACIADIATAPWEGWLKHVFSKYGITPKSLNSTDLFNTPIGDVSKTVSSTEVFDRKLVPGMLTTFLSAKTYEDITSSKYGKYKKIIDGEIKKHIAAFDKKAEKHGKMPLYIYEMTSKYHVHSPISTILGLKYPNRTIIIINKTRDPISVSARRGDKKYPVNELLSQAVNGFEKSNAGGHAPAAGAGFPKKHLKEFKERLITLSKKAVGG